MMRQPQRRVRCAVPALILAATLGIAQPAEALSRHDWAVASTVGEIGLGAVALGVPLLKGDQPGMWQAGGSILLGEGIAQGLKQVVHERRPDGSGNDSFPSAHTAASFAAAATMHRRYGWEVGLPATLVATFVGVARVQADKHHWYDVVAGAAIGEASGLLITRSFGGESSLVPWADSHGGGVAMALRF
jgi:membrane-associated phospholipid phosphatase